MIETNSPIPKIAGEILLFDAQGNSNKTCIENCLIIVDADGKTSAPTIDADGTFTGELHGTAPFTLQATFSDELVVFAFEKTCSPNEMPTIQIPVQVGQTGIQLFAWTLSSTTFGSDPKVDVQFARDTAKACIEMHDALANEGSSETEIWRQVKRILKTAFENGGTADVTCKTCNDRYYTPGTPYYMNYPAYQKCLYNPPCTS